jgi:hypothetical protein
MSHMSKIELIIKDAEVLKKACLHLNMQYSCDTAKFRQRGCEVEERALAVITVLGLKPVISVVPEGGAFALRSLVSVHGTDLERMTEAVGQIKQRYAVEHVLAEARNKRMRIQETVTETGVRLVLTAY